MIGFIEEFGVLLLIIVGVSFVVKWIKQPIILGYVLSGLLFSLIVGQYSVNGELIVMMSELGITFLLFLIGLEFDLKSLKYLGKDISFALLIQSILFFVVPFVLGMVFHFTVMESVYLGILFMFSSTLLVAKWLEDKKETATLHGKIILGLLILQDLLAIIALTFLSVLREKSFVTMLTAPFKGFLLLLIAFLFTKYLLNRLLRFASRFPELLFIFSIGVCFLFVILAPLLGYSTTIGAFIGGIALANTIYKNDVAVRLKPLIIFFNMLFFVGLGFQMDLNLGLEHLLLVGILTGLCILAKPYIIHFTLRQRGYDTKTSFLSGIYLAQLSEFGIIIVAAGVLLGMVGNTLGSIATISVILTMVLSSYLIKSDKKIYAVCESHLRLIDRFFKTKEVKQEPLDPGCNVLFFGYYVLSRDILAKLGTLGKKIVVIENDPEHIELLKREKISYIYNTINNPEFFETLNLKNVELVVSSYADVQDNKIIIHHLKEANPKAVVIVNAKNMKDSLDLYNSGADYVINPSYINEKHVSVLLEDYTTDINKVISKKIEDITRFQEREETRKKVHEEQTQMWDIDKFFNINLMKHKPKQKSEEHKSSASLTPEEKKEGNTPTH